MSGKIIQGKVQKRTRYELKNSHYSHMILSMVKYYEELLHNVQSWVYKPDYIQNCNEIGNAYLCILCDPFLNHTAQGMAIFISSSGTVH